MTLKRKVLDPWRVQPEPSLDDKKSQVVTDVDPDQESFQFCVRLKGWRCGVNVWLNYKPTEDDTPVADALTQINKCLLNLFNNKLGSLLNEFGIFFNPLVPNSTLIGLGDKLYVKPVERSDDLNTRVATTICFALRVVMTRSTIGLKIIKEHGIKPYVS